jgi:hypothetical protein
MSGPARAGHYDLAILSYAPKPCRAAVTLPCAKAGLVLGGLSAGQRGYVLDPAPERPREVLLQNVRGNLPEVTQEVTVALKSISPDQPPSLPPIRFLVRRIGDPNVQPIELGEKGTM